MVEAGSSSDPNQAESNENGRATTNVPPDPSRPAATPEVPPPLTIVPDYTEAGVPTFERVRDKIEERLGTAIGAEELGRDSRSGRDLDEQWEAREKAARDKLDEIRRSMKND
ncbi:PspA/IM30 family protein [Prescottella subtropica]|uniref:PspA/IM30 family protein n=1 Tax=Prescottella subtropica TaxID=2545757 RepID=UPI001F4F333E|nr:hypothetical protein [Prescottella subtropica]